MKDEEMAEEYLDEKCKDCYMCSYSEHKNPYKVCQRRKDRKQAFLAGLKAGRPQWHKVTDGKLPKLDKKVWVIRSADDDIPMVAKRHIYTSYGRAEWEWKCYWGSGFDLKQNEIFAWCEIPTFDKE